MTWYIRSATQINIFTPPPQFETVWYVWEVTWFRPESGLENFLWVAQCSKVLDMSILMATLIVCIMATEISHVDFKLYYKKCCFLQTCKHSSLKKIWHKFKNYFLSNVPVGIKLSNTWTYKCSFQILLHQAAPTSYRRAEESHSCPPSQD